MTPRDVLKRYWGFDFFRPLQEDIVDAVLSKKDVLALLPTGGGKSICFQVPGLLTEGVCLVISPLIALMKDQVEQLKVKGIDAASIDSSLHRREVDLILERAVQGNLKFLYISPERLVSQQFQGWLRNMKVGLIAIDEAHCISQWGYDFRPAYLGLNMLRTMLPEVTIIALTATATEIVRKDIIEKLGLSTVLIFRKSFARANLSYSCFEEDDKNRKLLEILTKVPGSAVVYTRNRAKTKEVAGFLNKNSISADFYHAGLPHAERTSKQMNWISDKRRVMVATNAFGMGIDKPNVRTVIHMDIPDSPEAYYQEAGRAGRDEKKAYAVALFTSMDVVELKLAVEEKFPNLEFIKTVYQALGNFFQVANGSAEAWFNFDLGEFHKRFDLDQRKTFFALSQLQYQGLLLFNESFYAPSKIFIPDHAALYEFQIANAKYDPFIKLLLRLYGGNIFTDFVKIGERQFAQKLGVNEEVLQNILKALHQAGILIYQAQKDKPQIAFLPEKYSLSELPFNSLLYKQRKNDALDKVNTISNYLQNAQRCRTILLLAYFGEVSDIECGICDNCVRRKKLLTDFTELEREYEAQIALALNKENLYPEVLINLITPLHKDLFTNVIKSMIDFGILQYDSGGKLFKM